MTRRHTLYLLFGIVLLCAAAAGCQRRGKVLTKDYDGRRVADFEVEGDRIAYIWYPAEKMSVRGHLVVLNTKTGEEITLDDDMSGRMAMSGGKVIWLNARLRDEEGKCDLNLYDLDESTSETILHEKIGRLDFEGNYIVWSRASQGASDIILFDLRARKKKTIAAGGGKEKLLHRYPKIRGGFLAWETYSIKNKKALLNIYDIQTGSRATLDMPKAHTRFDISGKYLVYVERQRDLQEIHLFDISQRSDSVIATLERLSKSPCIEGDKIAWCEHIRKEEFQGVPGQPLMDEKDFHNIFLYDLNSGRRRRIASSLLLTAIELYEGHLYANVYRGVPPPRATNLIVPIDIRRW